MESQIAERLATEIETVVYRVVQEALTNVARHADAERVSLTLTATDRLISADIVDDGVGFDGIEVVGEAGNAADAVAIATEADPDVFVMDLGLPGTSGMRRPTDPRASPRICSSRSARSRPIAPTSSTSSA